MKAPQLLIVVLFSRLLFADLSASTEGFYPLWESTGWVEKRNQLYVGTNGAHYGVLDIAQIGLQPVNFLYRVPNLNVKIAVFQGERARLTFQQSVYCLLEQSGRGTFSPMYPSRLDNPNFSLWLVPSALGLSYRIGDWLEIHQTATAMPIFSRGPIRNEIRGGYTIVAELGPEYPHGFLLHGGAIGILERDFYLAGVSYRYRNTWLEFRLGYFYRMYAVGTQSAPHIGVGVHL